MQRVSYRTLFLLVMLLGLIIVQQHTAKAVCARPDAIWLVNEPNEPGPEVALGVPSTLRLDEDPNDPGPEVALGIPSALRLTDDPNDPGPERV